MHPGVDIGMKFIIFKSKKLAPEYSAAAADLKKLGGDNYVPLAKVDATAEASVAEKFSI